MESDWNDIDAVVDAALEQRWNIDRCKAGAWAMVDVMWGIRGFNTPAAAKKIKKPNQQ